MNDNESEFEEEEMEEIDMDDMEEIVLPNDQGLSAEDDSEDEQNDNPEENKPSSPVKDDSDFVFKKHTGPVFCCALDPKNGNLAVSGGEDDKAYVWEIQEGQVLLECTGHKDSVTMAGFSYDGSFVATADMCGVVQVWRVATRTLTWSNSVGDLSWLRWHQGTNVLFCAAISGEVYMWKMPGGECKVLPGHGAATDAGILMPDGRRLTVGYSDGNLKVFDLKTVQAQLCSEIHSLSVSCLDAHSDNNLVASGAADGTVVLFKTQPIVNAKVLWTFDCHPDDTNSFVEAVAFSKDPSLSILAAATLNGKLYILDFANQVLRHKCEQESGISRLVWDRHSPAVFVGSLDGVVRVYQAHAGILQASLRGHRETILDICLSLDGNTLLSSSDDGTCRVYAVSPPER